MSTLATKRLTTLPERLGGASCLQYQSRRYESSAPPQSGITSMTRDMMMRSKKTTAERNRTRERVFQAAADTMVLYQNQTRYYKPGDVYSPRDMMPGEMRKWRKREAPSVDIFDNLGINPLSLYKVGLPLCRATSSARARMVWVKGWLLMNSQNYSVMSQYVTDMGRIKHSADTGLRPVNQRKIAKAVRRAIGLGLMPSSYRHPMLIAEQMEKEAENRKKP
ncbi:hypothetical protein KEM55_004644 [Ascosphaera atra]|nr:hypothetical protein KEM55_004644 [Ascosphaera atra]